MTEEEKKRARAYKKDQDDEAADGATRPEPTGKSVDRPAESKMVSKPQAKK